jgi:hypothetical protein
MMEALKKTEKQNEGKQVLRKLGEKAYLVSMKK